MQPLLLNAVGLFATAYIIRRLGAAQYGAWAVAVSLTSANAFLTNLGLRPLFVRALTRDPERTAELLADQLGVRLRLAVIGAAMAVLAALAMGYPPVVIGCVLVCDFSLLFAVAWTVLGDVLQAMERFRSLAIGTFASGLMLTAVS